jgi:hypothetical protein
VLSFRCSSSMHSQSSNSSVVDVVDVAGRLGPALSINHGMTMDQLDIIWCIAHLNGIMRHQYLPLLVMTDWGKGVLASTRFSAMQSPSL